MLMWTVCSVWYACIGVGSALNEVYLYWCGNVLNCCPGDVGNIHNEVCLLFC